MSEEYAAKLLKHSLAQICSNLGFSATTTISFEVLMDLLSRYVQKLAGDLRVHADHQFGRTEPLIDDLGMVFRLNGISLRELDDYIKQTTPTPLPFKVPRFPVRKQQDCILYAKPSEKELKERPEYIPHYFPSLYSNRKNAGVESRDENEKKGDAGLETEVAGRIRRQASTRVTDMLHRMVSEQTGLPDFSDFDAIKAGLVKVVEPSPSPPPIPAPIIVVSQSSKSVPPTKITLKLPPPQEITSAIESVVIPTQEVSSPGLAFPLEEPPGPAAVPQPPPEKWEIPVAQEPAQPPKVLQKKKIRVKKTKPQFKKITNWTQESLFGKTLSVRSVAAPPPEPKVVLKDTTESQSKPNQEELKHKLVNSRLHYSKDKLKERLQKRSAQKQKKEKEVETRVKSFPPIAKREHNQPLRVEENPLILTLKVQSAEPPQKLPPTVATSAPAVDKPCPAKRKPNPKKQGKLISPLRIKFKGFQTGRKSGEDVKEERKRKKKDKQKGKEKRKRTVYPEESAAHTEELRPVAEDLPKVPRLILKVPKPPDGTEKHSEEETPKVAPIRFNLKEIGASRKISSATPVEEPSLGFHTPPPKSPSLHSRSPGSEIGEKAASPPPHTPSPHSNSEHSPLRVDIQNDDIFDVPPRTPTAGLLTHCIPSPATKVISPAQTGSISPAISGVSGEFQGDSNVEDAEKEWFCPVCGVKYDDEADMIGCDGCDNWFHWHCVGLLEAPPDDQNWYCNNCPPRKKTSKAPSHAATRGRKKGIPSKRGRKKTKS